MYRIQLSKKAAKFYQKVDTVTVRRINLAFTKLSEDPHSPRNVKPLTAEFEGSFRMRLGNIRIIYSVDDTNKIVYIESLVSEEMSTRTSGSVCVLGLQPAKRRGLSHPAGAAGRFIAPARPCSEGPTPAKDSGRSDMREVVSAVYPSFGGAPLRIPVRPRRGSPLASNMRKAVEGEDLQPPRSNTPTAFYLVQKLMI